MPVKIPSTLPARTVLENENIFVMDEDRAIHQDIRALRFAILNLMPTKITTETQLLRLLSNSALQIEVTLLHTATYESKNTDADHLLNHYYTFEDVRDQKFDGLIITGAPVEQMPFEEVDYWAELTQIFDWAETNVESTFYICWGAQAGLYHRYGIPKYDLPRKMFGVFEHRVLNRTLRHAQGGALGLRTVIFTDIRRDGLGSGLNIAATRALADASGIDVIASGGVHTMDDVMAAREAGLAGTIIGRALY